MELKLAKRNNSKIQNDDKTLMIDKSQAKHISADLCQVIEILWCVSIACYLHYAVLHILTKMVT